MAHGALEGPWRERTAIAVILGDSHGFALDVIVDEELSAASGELWVWAQPVIDGMRLFNTGGRVEQAGILEVDLEPTRWNGDRKIYRPPSNVGALEVTKAAFERWTDCDDHFDAAESKIYFNSCRRFEPKPSI